jgi:hypothetical protein
MDREMRIIVRASLVAIPIIVLMSVACVFADGAGDSSSGTKLLNVTDQGSQGAGNNQQSASSSGPGGSSWPYPTFHPTMPQPASSLYVADLRPLGKDERVLLLSLQGIVNRTQPRIFVLQNDNDPFWLKQLQSQGYTKDPMVVSDPLSLVTTFRNSIKGAVVADPKVYVSPLIAVDVAAVSDVVVATPDLAKRLGLPIVEDLRGKFADNAAALRYARTELMPKMNPCMGVSLYPDILDSGTIDYAIAARGITFWVTGSDAQSLPGANLIAEQTEVELMLKKMPVNTPIFGYWWAAGNQGLGEENGVTVASEYGKVTCASDFTANFSVYSGYRIDSLKQKTKAPCPALDRSKVYVAFTMSDGDNLHAWRDSFYPSFEDPLHGQFPMGWGMAPSLIDCAPPIARWYYEHATSTDEFFCDVSGIGYIYPAHWAARLDDREGATKSFYGWTKKYMDRMDLHSIRQYELGGMHEEDIQRAVKELSIGFVLPDYKNSREAYEQLTYRTPSGQAVFRASTQGVGAGHPVVLRQGGDVEVCTMADQIKARVGDDWWNNGPLFRAIGMGPSRPRFLNAFLYNWETHLSDVKQTIDTLGTDYVIVTPSQLNELYNQAYPADKR